MQIHRETPYLKAECQRRGIHPPFDDPKPAQLIPIIEERLAIHQKHFGRSCEPGSGYRNEWDEINTDLERFLAQLRAAAGFPITDEPAETILVGRRCPQRAASVTEPPTSPPGSSVNSSRIKSASTPPPAEPPKNVSAENAGLSGSTIDNQQSSAGSDPVPAGSDPVPAGSDPGFAGPMPVPAGSEPPKTASTRPTRQQSDEEDRPSKATEHEQQKERQDEQSQPNAGPDKQIRIEDYLRGYSFEAALDLQSYLAGRSPLDKLPPNEQQAIVRLLKDYEAWRVRDVIAQPRPTGLGIRTSKTALNLFARRFKDANDEAIKAANQKAIDDLIAAANGADDVFQTAVQRCLKTRLLLATSGSAPDLAAINTLVLSLTRLRKQALAEQKKS